MDEKLLTVSEFSRALRVDDTTVRRWIKNGSLEAITLPHKGKRQMYRIKQSTLDALLAQTATGKTEPLARVSPLVLPRYDVRK